MSTHQEGVSTALLILAFMYLTGMVGEHLGEANYTQASFGWCILAHAALRFRAHRFPAAKRSACIQALDGFWLLVYGIYALYSADFSKLGEFESLGRALAVSFSVLGGVALLASKKS